MQEVEAMCDRVVMIQRGRIVEDAPLDTLMARGGLEAVFDSLAGA